MEFRVLGPVEVEVGGEVVAVPAPRHRTLLALLVVHVGEVLSTDRMIEELWGDDAPASGANALRFHVSKLRSALGVDPSPIVTQGSGYVLDVDAEAVDAFRFEELLSEAIGAVGEDPDRAAVLVGDALSLWRGVPYSDLGDPGFADGEVRRLSELRMRAVEVGFAADLARGNAAAIVGDLEATLVEFPFRERLWAHLMVALYRSGRQADALRAFRRASDALGEGLGIEPSAELADLEQRILLHDPALDYKARLRSNLPSPASSFIGRESEIVQLVEWCDRDRLVTITGVGGIGKTRLAIEVARQCLPGFVDGVFFIDLIEVSDSELVPRRFVSGMELVERSDEPTVESLVRYLSGKRCLLVVDNCEHVVDGVADLLAVLVPACPDLHIVATSRVRVGVPGERLWELGGLPTGQEYGGGLGESDAASLFADRARLVRSGFLVTASNGAIVTSICRGLDGIPLAIELAAARVRIMTIGEIAERLSDRFAFLTDVRNTGPARHRTLRSMIDWSYDLLAEPNQRLFRLLGVFRGGFNLDALQSVSTDPDLQVADALERLVDASLVTVDTTAPVTRYRLLVTVREFATDQLEANGETGATRDRHLAFYASMAEEAFQRMDTPYSPPAISDEDSLAWRSAVGSDLANLQHALDWALQADNLDTALVIVTPLADYLIYEENVVETIEHLDAVLNRDDCPETPLYVAAITTLGRALAVADDRIRAEAALDEAERAASRLDIRYGRADISTWRAVVAGNRGDAVEAVAHLDDALERAEEDADPRMSRYLWNMGLNLLFVGELDRTRELVVRFNEEGIDDRRRATGVRTIIAAYQGNHQESLELAREGLALSTVSIATNMYRLFAAEALINLGQLDEARAILESVESFYRDRGNEPGEYIDVLLGLVELRSGSVGQARIRLHNATSGAHTRGDRSMLWVTFYAATEWFAHTDDHETAAILLGHCAALTEEHRYAPQALGCVPLVTLETLADALDPERFDVLVAEGASADTDELAGRVLRLLTS